ncbi:MAG: hypothetical protein ACP5UH_01740 [Candidatus Micrarchaeia archaeon]
MKAQTTLEFVLLLAAVASFSTILLGIYSGFMHGQKSALLEMGGIIEPNSTGTNTLFDAAAGDFYIAALVQNTTHIGVETTLQAVLYVPESERIEMLELNASNAYVAQPKRYNVGNGTVVESFDVVPLSGGAVGFNLTAVVNDSGLIEKESAYALSYAVASAVTGQEGQNTTTQIFASIKRDSESIDYGAGGASNIYTIGVWNHCSYTGFWSNELSLGQECGSSASWYFWVSSWYCTWAQGLQSDTMTYCFYKEPSGVTISHISQNATYNYSISLALKLDTLDLNASLSSSEDKASLLEGGTGYGDATVTSVSGTLQDLSQGYLVLHKSGSSQGDMINASQYAPYSQASASTEGMLAYYNNTHTSSSSLQYVLQAISSMNNQAEELSNTTSASVSSCTAIGNSVSCAPLPYLYYTIDAVINNDKGAQEIDYEGSMINVS